MTEEPAPEPATEPAVKPASSPALEPVAEPMEDMTTEPDAEPLPAPAELPASLPEEEQTSVSEEENASETRTLAEDSTSYTKGEQTEVENNTQEETPSGPFTVSVKGNGAVLLSDLHINAKAANLQPFTYKKEDGTDDTGVAITPNGSDYTITCSEQPAADHILPWSSTTTPATPSPTRST